MITVSHITEKIPMWSAEGRDALSDNRNIWDKMKYITEMKRKGREKNEKENNL